MATRVSTIFSADSAAVEWTEKDLLRRLDMLTEDADRVVVIGLVTADLLDPAALDNVISNERPGQLLDLKKYGIPADHFAQFQRLWYHFRVPYARASLVWWYLFCLAMRRDRDVGRAVEQMAEWVGRLVGPAESVLPRAAELLGLPDAAVVVTDDETGDVDALLLAARRRAPLMAVHDLSAALEAGRAGGFEVLTARTPSGAPPGQPWLVRQIDLAALPDQARQAWQQLPDEDRNELLAQLEQRVTSIERLRLLLDEQEVDNREVAKHLVACQAEPVTDWPLGRLALVTLLRCWHEAGFVLHELNQSFVSFPAVAAFLARRIQDYRDRLGEPGDRPPATAGILALAGELAGYRQQIEQSYERCLHFDGSNWERREFLLPRAAYRHVHDVPQSLREHLYAITGVDVPEYRNGDYLAAWDVFLERVLAAGGTPTRVMQEIAHWAANVDDLNVDMAVFTAPLGTKLDQPWTMEFTDLFCYTGFRAGLDLQANGIPTDLVGVQNVMGQRMRYNAVKKAQNYAPVRRFPAQGFNLPDIAIAEDANHAGHAIAAVRLACRVPITIKYREWEWNGLSDVRLNRAVYRRENRFQPRDLITTYRYAQWTKGVADATYRRGLQFDRKWGDKVRDLDL